MHPVILATIQNTACTYHHDYMKNQKLLTLLCMHNPAINWKTHLSETIAKEISWVRGKRSNLFSLHLWPRMN